MLLKLILIILIKDNFEMKQFIFKYFSLKKLVVKLKSLNILFNFLKNTILEITSTYNQH